MSLVFTFDDLYINLYFRYINNGVYRSGFATSQEAYNEAVTALFEHLDKVSMQFSILFEVHPASVLETLTYTKSKYFVKISTNFYVLSLSFTYKM